jgi:hypothetical protein
LVFDRWKGLKSFDVCLEPLASEDAGPAPAPMTQLLVTRRGARAVDWSAATLTDLLAAANEHGATQTATADFFVYFRERLDDQPKLAQARLAAARR